MSLEGMQATSTLVPARATEGGWGICARASLIDAVKHFNRFACTIFTEDNFPGADKAFGGKEHFYENLVLEEVTTTMLDHFAGFLGTVKHLNNASLALSCNTADRYLSAIKNGLIRRDIADGGNKICFDKAHLSIVRAGMLKGFTERAISENKKLSKTKETTSDSDIFAIPTLCFWTGCSELADMNLFFASLRFLSGRGGEVATLKHNENVSVKPRPQWDKDEFRWNVWLWRPKLDYQQDLAIFTDRHSILANWVFAYGYSMVMHDSPSEYLFPTFARHAIGRDPDSSTPNQDKTEKEICAKKQDSRVSKHFSRFIMYLSEVAVSYNLLGKDYWVNHQVELGQLQEQEDAIDDPGEQLPPQQRPATDHETVSSNWQYTFASQKQVLSVNPKLSSHSQKRQSVQEANAHPLLHTTWVCFRAGWLMKSIHTIFDYIRPSVGNDEEVALVMSKWTTSNGCDGRMGGGHPPLLRALRDHADALKVDKFVQILFSHYESVFDVFQNVDAERKVKMMTAELLRGLREFLNILEECPDGTYRSSPRRLEDDADDDDDDDDYGDSDPDHGYSTAFQNHRFLVKLKLAAHEAGVENPVKTLLEWSDLVMDDFLKRNYFWADWKDVEARLGRREMVIDTRSMAGFMSATVDQMQGAQNEVHCVARRQEDHTREVRDLKHQLGVLDRKVDLLTHKLAERDQRAAESEQRAAEERQTMYSLLASVADNLHIPFEQPTARPTSTGVGVELPEPPAPPTPPQQRLDTTPGTLDFPKTLKDLNVKQAFVNWHHYGYYRAIGTHATQGSNTQRSVASSLKLAVEYLSLFLDEQVPTLPQGLSSGRVMEAKEWRDAVSEMSEIAWNKAVVFLKLVPPIPEGTLAFKRRMYDIDGSKWPKGPHGESPLQPEDPKSQMKRYQQLKDHQETQRKREEKKKANKRKRMADENIAAVTH